MHLGGGGGGANGGGAQWWHYQTHSTWDPPVRLGAGGTSYVASSTNMGPTIMVNPHIHSTTTFTEGYLIVTPMTQNSATSFSTRTVDPNSITDLTGTWEDINASAEYDPPSADASQVLDAFKAHAYY